MSSSSKKIIFLFLIILFSISIFLLSSKKNIFSPEPQKSLSSGPYQEFRRGNTGPFKSQSVMSSDRSQNSPQMKDMLEREAEIRDQMVKGDLEILKDSQKDIPKFMSALMRLSTQRNPAARDKALELLKSKDKRLSMIAFRALGYYDEAGVNRELGILTRSREPELQRNAIFALSWNPKPGSARKVILEDFVNSSKGSDPNTMIAVGSLYRMSSNADEKASYFKKVLDTATTSKIPGEKFMAARTLMQMDPKNPVARELMTKIDQEFRDARSSVRKR
jgi:hypothetical protein